MAKMLTMLRKTKHIRIALPVSVLGMANQAYAAGLPQLDHHWYPNQLLWLVISFALLYTVISVFVAPSIHGVLSTRSTAIDEAIREAERAKQLAESTKHGSESANLDARNQSAAFLAKAQAEVSANMTEAFAKLDHDLDRKLKQADVRIEESKQKALKASETATVSLASAMVEKLLGRAVDAAEVERAVSGAKGK